MTTPPPQGNPFAQGQPAAAPQAPFPPQGAAPYAPVPPQPSGRKLSFKTIKNIVIVIAVATIAVVGYITSRDDANTAAVGDCMHRGSTSDNNPDLEVVKCDDAKAQFKVLAKIEGSYLTETLASSKCEAEAKDFQYTYTESGDGKDFLLCLKDYKK